MPDFNCTDPSPITTEVPPPHFWPCCGFTHLPNSLSGTYSLMAPSTDDPTCLEEYGLGSHAFTLVREECSTLYYADGVPFYISGPSGLCSQSPRGANDNINSFGMGPGSPVYDGGNSCLQDGTTGVITLSCCANLVGSPCKFRVCFTM